MKSKRPARSLALQTLYAMDLTERGVHQVIGGVLEAHKVSDDQKKYGIDLIDLVTEHRIDLVESLKKHCINWSWDRLARIEQLVLLIGLAEARFRPDVPPKVVLNEAVEIANKFSTEQSASFVNGVLHSAMSEFVKFE